MDVLTDVQWLVLSESAPANECDTTLGHARLLVDCRLVLEEGLEVVGRMFGNSVDFSVFLHAVHHDCLIAGSPDWTIIVIVSVTLLLVFGCHVGRSALDENMEEPGRYRAFIDEPYEEEVG